MNKLVVDTLAHAEDVVTLYTLIWQADVYPNSL